MPKKPPQAQRMNPDKRPSRQQRGYGKLHRQLREKLLNLYPYCQICNSAFSYHAHHLKYPAETIQDYLALCSLCHHKLHAQEGK